MNYKKEVLKNKKVKFTVDVDATEFNTAIEEAYQKNKHKFTIEGFRKGKAPRRVIEQQYGKGVFFEDAIDIVLPKVYGEILDKEKKVEVVARPDVDIVDITDAGELKVTFEVAVKPEVELGAYTNLEIKGEKASVSKEDVDNALKAAQDKASRLVVVSEDRGVKNGETANIDFVGSVDGVEFQGGKGEKYDLELGSNMFIPGFEEQVVGMKVSEAKDVKVSFPKEYGAQELAGKDAVFKVTLNEIKVKEVPALDDEFAKDVSEFDTLDEYKKDVKATIKADKEKQADAKNEEALIDAIVANAKMDVPAEMIDYQAEQMIKEFEYRLMYQGMKMDDYLKYLNLTLEDLKKQYLPTAEKTVKTRLVLEAIIKQEKIKATKKEVDTKVEEIIKQHNLKPEQIDEKEKSFIESDVKTEKLLKFLKENNKIK